MMTNTIFWAFGTVPEITFLFPGLNLHLRTGLFVPEKLKEDENTQNPSI